MNPYSWLHWAWSNLKEWWHRQEGKRMDCTLIEDGLYQGGSIDQLPQEIRAVVSLENDCQDQLCPGRIEGHLWLPIADGYFPGVRWLDTVTSVLGDWHERGWSVLVHCHMGISRSTLVVTAYLMRSRGWTWREALEYVKSKRPCIDPNPYFITGLADYEEYLRGKDSHA